MPAIREGPTTASHDLHQVRPRAQQGAPPRPTLGLSLNLGLGRRSPPRPTLGLGLNLGLGRRSLPRLTLGLGLSLGLEGVAASPDLGLESATLLGIHHYPTLSWLPQATKEQDRCPI
jgi:hypothetical protein